jgi:hypothetical protein
LADKIITGRSAESPRDNNAAASASTCGRACS